MAGLVLQSPLFLTSDEGALVRAAKDLGVVFEARTPDSMIISVVGVSYSALLPCLAVATDPWHCPPPAWTEGGVQTTEPAGVQ